jgi:hypothetical protein
MAGRPVHPDALPAYNKLKGLPDQEAGQAHVDHLLDVFLNMEIDGDDDEQSQSSDSDSEHGSDEE